MRLVLNRINKISLDAFTLKMIAIIAMTIDHIGCLFFPNIMIFRIIGRLTVPIMAFFISEGYKKTRNVKRYMLRLGIFALISMVPFHLAFKYSYFNILFDLLFGLIIIYINDNLEEEWKKWGIVLLFSLIANILMTDGLLGVSALVYLFYRYKDDFKKMLFSMTMLYSLQLIIIITLCFIAKDYTVLNNYTTWIRPFALCSLFLIYKYNGSKGKSIKYLFYGFYPGHLLILYFINKLIH